MTDTDTTPEPADQHVRPFASWIREQARGKSHDELSDGLHDLVAKVKETGKKGSLIYKVTVAPLDKDGEAMQVSDEITLKLPEHDRPASIAYVDRAGNLTRSDPNQEELPLLVRVDDHNDADTKSGEINRRA